ncbi:MAG: hypothetical protein CMP34_00945 [Rickettsiales bacterium]|nr:hypothetical protein [Rickettsiales bacterium]|tara:strand:+ start:2130 stop:2960 length:831 start_codon:yes stop_codon:yes gene_type:complete
MKKILFVLITCSLDKSRDDVFEKVSKNIFQLEKKFRFFEDFIVFDNASTFKKTKSNLKKFPKVFKSSKNIGLWGAIIWLLNNYKKYLKKEYSYLYFMESDCFHFDLDKLIEAEYYLDNNNDIGSIRCQKFSVLFKFLYDKDLFFSKFVNDAIRLKSYPTNVKAYFNKILSSNNLYKSNLHPKIVGLNRIEVLKKIFNKLSKNDLITEKDFFCEYWKYYKEIGIINGGTMTEIANRNHHGKIFRASDVSTMDGYKKGYLDVRTAKLIKDGFTINFSE